MGLQSEPKIFLRDCLGSRTLPFDPFQGIRVAHDHEDRLWIGLALRSNDLLFDGISVHSTVLGWTITRKHL